MANDDLRDDRIVRRRGRNNADAVSRLCRAWIRAGGDALAAGFRIAADRTDDTVTDCSAGGRRRDRDSDRD